MPANLTPQYLKAEERYKQAKTDPEKLLALEEMLATIPKHKGTEKLQGDIKQRISRLKKESLKKKGSHHWESDFFAVKEGAGQIVILGPPNTGKSQLLASLTSAHPESNKSWLKKMPPPTPVKPANRPTIIPIIKASGKENCFAIVAGLAVKNNRRAA